MIYEFEVPSKIIGKGRPRLNTYTGSGYTPTRTKDYETLIEQYFIMKYPGYKTIEGRVIVRIKAFFEIPKSTSNMQREQMLQNAISPTKKPDIDNIVKIILDAMNKFAFKDDTQIVKLEVEKLYSSDEEKLQIQIEEF